MAPNTPLTSLNDPQADGTGSMRRAILTDDGFRLLRKALAAGRRPLCAGRPWFPRRRLRRSGVPTRTPAPPPEVKLSAAERELWRPLPPDRSGIPVLLYHGIGPPSEFSSSVDAEYGIDRQAFAKQMTFLHHAGYQTVRLSQFVDFVEGKKVPLPPRPVLLTFDDGRADSWTGGDGILRKLGFNAVMFVDVGRVDREEPEYLTWEELETAQRSGRWELQLHSGEGHQFIRFGPGKEDFGPFYAYREPGESFEEWRERALGDIERARRHSKNIFPISVDSRSPLPMAVTGRTAPTTAGSPGSCSAG